jgi:hypothetical protein
MTTQAYLYRIGDLLQLPRADDGSDSYSLHMSGQASTLPAEEENETVRMLREVVKEITGRDVEQPTKPRIGFLP